MLSAQMPEIKDLQTVYVRVASIYINTPIAPMHCTI